MEPRESFFDSDGVKLHYLDWGGAGRPLVLLAGLGDNAQIYRGLALRLTGHFRVLALTRRGHGRSQRPDSGYDLNTLVTDIRRFLDSQNIAQAVLVGHSFAGLEMPRLAVRYPQRVAALVFLDALFPPSVPEPDLSWDPTVATTPTEKITAVHLQSRQTYLDAFKRFRPAWANLWGAALEANLMDRVTQQADGRLIYHHDDALMNQIFQAVWHTRNPEYSQVQVPILALVPDGSTHQAVPPGASDTLRQAADRFWQETLQLWLRQRTHAFQQTAPGAQVVTLDSPYHHIFLAQEPETAQAITDFLVG